MKVIEHCSGGLRARRSCIYIKNVLVGDPALTQVRQQTEHLSMGPEGCEGKGCIMLRCKCEPYISNAVPLEDSTINSLVPRITAMA